ncbi:hypothetical protein [Bradyrhizobium sp.]|uniref:hypothetical protein n=1 Tax=Bradyrhizobium sp. TaxID=376 RepID=UPI0025BB57CD|nr:hypothetical protein [Bradyrhizobium sp.]
MEDLAKIDRVLDELLVSVGGLVLRLASPQVSRTIEERQALARSVKQFSACARRSTDPRVQQINDDLVETLRPRLRLVASR